MKKVRTPRQRRILSVLSRHRYEAACELIREYDLVRTLAAANIRQTYEDVLVVHVRLRKYHEATRNLHTYQQLIG